MQPTDRTLQVLGISFAAMLSMVFGLFVFSFPLGAFVVFESQIGDDINHEYPITHLDLFSGTEMYRTPIDISIGDAFIIMWALYAILFAIAVSGPRLGFLKSISPVIFFGRHNRSNYMVGVIKWFSVLVLVSVLINFVQEMFGITIDPPPVQNDLIQFFYVSMAPFLEEFGFRMILIGIPLFTLYSFRPSARHFLKCLWNPTRLDIVDFRKAAFLVVFVGVLFGFAHIVFGESWSEGKLVQATAGGIILGWVYLRYGFVASVLIHWATNYFVFSYLIFISQLNSISFEQSSSHPLMSSLEMLLILTGVLAVVIMLAKRCRKEPNLEV